MIYFGSGPVVNSSPVNSYTALFLNLSKVYFKSTCVHHSSTCTHYPNVFFPSTECKINPSPGRCSENEKRTFYSFSNKVGGCVEIYGCYTINDRNVWYTRHGCKRSCLVPKPGAEGNQNNVAAG